MASIYRKLAIAATATVLPITMTPLHSALAADFQMCALNDKTKIEAD